MRYLLIILSLLSFLFSYIQTRDWPINLEKEGTSNNISNIIHIHETLPPYSSYNTRDIEIETIGAWSNIFGGGYRNRGNVVYVEETVNLIEFQIYLSIPNPTNLTFGVLRTSEWNESVNESSTFNLITEYSFQSDSGEGWYVSPEMNISLESGYYYYLAVYWEDSLSYGLGFPGYLTPLSFGYVAGSSGGSGPFYDLYETNEANSNGSNYYMTIVTGDNESDGDLNGDGEVNIFDIIVLVNLVFNSEYNESGDINGDGILNITDCILLVNLILDN